MLGLIQKILLDLVEQRAGPEAVLEVKRRAGVPDEKTFRLGVPYDDFEARRLLAAGQEVLGLDGPAFYKAYADVFCTDALTRWPTWWAMSKTARELLERQPMIHNAFATGVQDPQTRKAITDKFWIEPREGGIVTHYRSPNRLCELYVALGAWVIDYYGERASLTQPRCMHRGDPECEIHVVWLPGGGSP